MTENTMQTIAGIMVIEAQGTPYQIGFEHGSKGKQQVLSSIKTYQAMFQTYADLSWEDAKQRSRSYLEYINQFDEDLVPEMQGIADGAEVDLEDILALNARSEVVMMSNKLTNLDGCTALALTPEATKTGNTLLAQNWDWKGTQLDSLILLKMQQQNKPHITMMTEAGIIGKIGFNSAGLGVCLNALGSPGQPCGVPLHILLRGILNSVKISDALEKINSFKNACPANYLIAHQEGEALNVEKAPGDFDVFYPKDGILIHTNHFISKQIRVEDTGRLMAPDSYIRLGRCTKLVAKSKGNLGVASIQEILRDHIEFPDSICRHNDPLDNPKTQMCTVFSIIMDLSALQMYVVKGAPCHSDYALMP